jgi:hypothetical protein
LARGSNGICKGAPCSPLVVLSNALLILNEPNARSKLQWQQRRRQQQLLLRGL